MSGIALVVVDMFNPYEHEDAALLTRSVEETIEPLTRLVRTAGARPDVEVIYVNDNYGDFTAGPGLIQRRALEGQRPDLVKPLLPADCAFLPKVRHSAFFGTPLEYLLRRQKVDTLVLAGQVTEQCILYTARDAYVREFTLHVARDCVAHIDPGLAEAALEMMECNMRATIGPGDRSLNRGEPPC
ncbi:cysteine hydrolase family protein [Nonomuraea typhae]|uniref:cysteine hydrolase family protein n=1 Tax=Nonomuraea typhae TaxID=2603600 RepID=UPI0012F82B95|nr:isochorismatase family cysteine hydrolase [Nonomuraea typhae]